MDEIGAYFKEKLNKADFERRSLENQARCIHNELDKLAEREKSISVREDAPDYVFQVECFEKSLDSEELIKIQNRKTELEKELSDIDDKLQENNNSVEKYRHLYHLSVDKVNNSFKSDVYDRLEFVLQLMDSDIVRAKLELAGILKEESADAN